jgi:hypothetical protein
MSDLIRDMIEAGRIKAEYLAQGGRPEDVISPERIQALQNGGPNALMEERPMRRTDGSVAGPYMPIKDALARGLIEEGAIPAVQHALKQGVHTVSSGFDTHKGVGFAIGRDRSGRVVRVER